MIRRVFKILFILLILNIIDSIVCIIIPLMMGELHFYPSFVDTLSMAFFAPDYFRTNITISLPVIRAIVLIATVSILIAYIAQSKAESVFYYLSLMFFILLIVAVSNTMSLIAPMSSNIPSLHEIFGEFWRNISTDIVILLYHIPLSIIPLLILMLTHRYKAMVSELKVLEVAPRVESE